MSSPLPLTHSLSLPSSPPPHTHRYLRPDASLIAALADLVPEFAGQAAAAANGSGDPTPSQDPEAPQQQQPPAQAQEEEVVVWRYVCRLAQSLSLSPADLQDACTDALHRAVFAVIGPSAFAIHKAIHAADDVTLRAAYAHLWGITSTQVRWGRERGRPGERYIPNERALPPHAQAQLGVPVECRCDVTSPIPPLSCAGGLHALYVAMAVPLYLPLEDDSATPPPATSPPAAAASAAADPDPNPSAMTAEAAARPEPEAASTPARMRAEGAKPQDAAAAPRSRGASDEMGRPPQQPPSSSSWARQVSVMSTITSASGGRESSVSSGGIGDAFTAPPSASEGGGTPRGVSCGSEGLGLGMRRSASMHDFLDPRAGGSAALTVDTAAPSSPAASVKRGSGTTIGPLGGVAAAGGADPTPAPAPTLWPPYGEGSADSPAALAPYQPAIDCLSLLGQYAAPHMKLRVIGGAAMGGERAAGTAAALMCLSPPPAQRRSTPSCAA